MQSNIASRLAPGAITQAQAGLLAARAEVARGTIDRWLAGFSMRPKTIRHIEAALVALRAEGELP
jgi:hypothetical protein